MLVDNASVEGAANTKHVIAGQSHLVTPVTQNAQRSNDQRRPCGFDV